MKKFAAILVAMVLGVVMALELPADSAVGVTNADGEIVGFGEFEGGTLELTLSADADGFLDLTFTGADGEIVTVEVMVGVDGELILVETLESLSDALAESGASSEVEVLAAAEFEASLDEAALGSEILATALENAAEEAEEGLGTAEEAIDGAADRGEDAAGEGAGNADGAGDDADHGEEGTDTADESTPSTPSAP